MPGPSDIVVVGSANIDLIAYTRRVPEAGETVVGDRFQMGFGGKGANQAVMARLLGSHVHMIGCLGDDLYGQMYLDNFAEYGVDVTHVYVTPGSTGVAPIWVEPDGTNRIIIVPGANDLLTPDQAAAGVEAHPGAAIIIGQFEIPQSVTARAFQAARSVGTLTLLNPAPAAPIADELLAATDWLIPNEIEFASIGGGDPFDDAALTRFAAETRCRLVVTLGEAGVALVGQDGTVRRVSADRVEAVDTTGAGDAFVGSFGHGLAIGLDELAAAQLAMACASDSVTRPGTQTSFPDAVRCRELRRELGLADG
ncbi:MAG: ribokinase [Acidimicrobiia bacterium]|nr:ribokinase [Acidimicrobiia bacterium]